MGVFYRPAPHVDPMAEDDGAAGILLLLVVDFHRRDRARFFEQLVDEGLVDRVRGDR
jgi:hypothetical protein